MSIRTYLFGKEPIPTAPQRSDFATDEEYLAAAEVFLAASRRYQAEGDRIIDRNLRAAIALQIVAVVGYLLAYFAARYR